MQVGLLGLMFVVLFTLKLLGLVTISWWIVTLPLWIGIVIFFIALIFVLMMD